MNCKTEGKGHKKEWGGESENWFTWTSSKVWKMAEIKERYEEQQSELYRSLTGRKTKNFHLSTSPINRLGICKLNWLIIIIIFFFKQTPRNN